MRDKPRFFSDRQWVGPESVQTCDVLRPAVEEKIADIAMGNNADPDKAVTADRTLFSWC